MIAHSFTITRNHNKSSVEPFLLDRRGIAPFWFCSVLLIQSRGGTIENTASSVVVFTAPLHSNGSYFIVACVFITAGMCLPSRCLAMSLYVTIWTFLRTALAAGVHLAQGQFSLRQSTFNIETFLRYRVIIVWHVNALPGNGSINTLHYTHAIIEQQGYATRF
jgi:hypothetical protein